MFLTKFGYPNPNHIFRTEVQTYRRGFTGVRKEKDHQQQQDEASKSKDAGVPSHQEATASRVGHHGVMNPLETWSDLSDSGYGVTRDHLYQTIQQVDNFLFFSLLLILSLFN